MSTTFLGYSTEWRKQVGQSLTMARAPRRLWWNVRGEGARGPLMVPLNSQRCSLLGTAALLGRTQIKKLH